MTVSPGKRPSGNDMEWIDIVDEAGLVHDGRGVFAEQNEFRMRNGKLLSVRRANRKWTEPAGQAFPQFLNVHAVNLGQG